MKAINFRQLKAIIRNRIDRTRDEARNHWREVVEADAPAGTLAAAFATGTLISTIPVPMMDMALAAFVLRRFSRLPRGPFFAAMALGNNLFMAPLYASTPRVGGMALDWVATVTPLEAPGAFLLRIVVGYTLIALGLAVASYTVARTGFRGYQFARARR